MNSISGINSYNRALIKEPTLNQEEDKEATLRADKEKEEVLKTDASQRSLGENEVLLKVGSAILKEAMNVEGKAVLSLLQSMGFGTNIDLQA